MATLVSERFNSEYDSKLLNMFFPPQARPMDLARGIPGKLMHLRSLTNALRFARNGLMYTKQSLSMDAHEWPFHEDTVSRELSASTLILEGLLDGLIILDNDDPAAGMSFTRTPFKQQRLQTIQSQMKDLRSADTQNSRVYADFWSLADFWKHYFPYQPRPSKFEHQGVIDFQINLGCGKSGPLLHDLVFPVFNGARQIILQKARELGLDDSFVVDAIV